MNADGYDDIVVGAPFGTIAIAAEGTVHVYAGVPFLVPQTDPCTDADGDGTTGCAGDCDDLDATSFPGAAEVCDGRDNGCAGEVGPSELDADADGALPCAGDCDDTTSSVAPALAEICGDLADNNCDGASDEDCPRAAVDEAGCGCGAPFGGGGASALVAAAALFTRLARRRG